MFGVFGCPAGTAAAGNPTFASAFTDACLKAAYPYLALQNTGTTTLSRKDVLTGKDDKLNNKQTTGYFDTIFTGPGDLEIMNQTFFDGTRNVNNNDYGFSQFVKSWVIEDKIVVSKKFETSAGKFSVQVSPSIRYTHFNYGDDFD